MVPDACAYILKVVAPLAVVGFEPFLQFQDIAIKSLYSSKFELHPVMVR